MILIILKWHYYTSPLHLLATYTLYFTLPVVGVKETIEAVGATVCYLPPYSPDLNLIEMLWSKLKSVFRKLKLRSLELLDPAIPLSFNTVSLSDIAGWFDNAGYSLS